MLGSQAGRLIANLIIAGGGILVRAAAQAYRQALVSELSQQPHVNTGLAQPSLKAFGKDLAQEVSIHSSARQFWPSAGKIAALHGSAG